MTYVTSLELSKRLYEASGWDDTDKCWYFREDYDCTEDGEIIVTNRNGREINGKVLAPAYDSGFLLRQLIDVRVERFADRWLAIDHTNKIETHEDTPEDALAELCLALFEAGVLKK